MSATSTVQFDDKRPTLFSPQEMRELMWIEFERSKRHDYPLACLVLQIDRLAALENLHGYHSKQELLKAVADLVKSETRNGDLLTCLADDRLTALFPHTGRELTEILAQRILGRARGLEFDAAGRSVRITLSIGLSHNQHPHAQSFPTLLRVAEEGLSVADAAGGDRCIETELYELVEDRLTPAETEVPDHIMRAVAAAIAQATSATPQPAPRLELELEEPQETPVEEEIERLAAELAEQKLRAMQSASSLSSNREQEYLREIDVLERRISKLTNSLGLTEQELVRLREVKGIDPGISSIYREVQGLSGEDPNAERKQELMKSIFEANLGMREQVAEAARRSA